MKTCRKIFSAAIVLLILFLSAGCEKISKKDGEPASGQADSAVEAAQTRKLTCFFEGLSVKDEPGGTWTATLSFGETVEFSGEEQKEGNSTYYKITTESGDTGWSSSYYFIEDGIPAVTVAEDKIYKKPEPKGVTPDTLPIAYLICISPSDDASGKYSEINYLHPETGYVQLEKYMKSESVSTRKDDVDAAVLLLLARRAKEKDDKEAAATYLETALEEYPSSVLQPVIATELIEYQQNGSGSAAQEIIPLENRITGIINTETVNVRKTPSLKADILMSVHADTRVSLSKRTTVKEEIKGFHDYWYLADFADGQQGWVYGALITMEE